MTKVYVTLAGDCPEEHLERLTAYLRHPDTRVTLALDIEAGPAMTSTLRLTTAVAEVRAGGPR